MHGRGHRALGSAAAAIAFLAVATFPARLAGEGDPAAAGVLAALSCPGAPCDPGPARFADRLGAELEVRIPQLEPSERHTLARTILLEAEAARIDPLLVLALIEVESSFDPDALSVRGARGLMQLREPTMRRELERNGLALEDPLDPVANVQAGVRYLRRLLDAFGREEVALMAYNAGPNRILGYLREGEIPQRFHTYPRRVRSEVRRLRHDLGPSEHQAIAGARVIPGPQ